MAIKKSKSTYAFGIHKASFTPDMNCLYDLMVNISQKAFSSGWIKGNDFGIWGVREEQRQSYGDYSITTDDLNQLKQYADKIGGWIIWHDNSNDPKLPAAEWGPRFVTMDVWLKMVARRKG